MLRTALRLIDQHGVEALTMRRVATELGVDPMSLYRHVDNKDALLDGVVEQLWTEVAAPTDDASTDDEPDEPKDYEAVLHRLGGRLREAMLNHPHAAPLLLSRPVMPRAALELLQQALEAVKAAGFDEQRAAAIVRCVSSVAMSDAALRVSYGWPLQEPADGEPSPDQWISIAQLLPPDTPPDLVRVAWTVCPPPSADGDFDVALELIIAGAERLREQG